METKSTLSEEVKKILDKNLELRGLRKTPERYAIIKEIYSFKHHFDADELYTRMLNKNYRVSKATIYNTLDLLVGIDLVTRHVFKDNIAKYEKSFGFRQHDHIILDNDEILEFCDPRIQSIKNSVEEIFNVKIKDHSLYFFGTKKKK
jgi:Fur family ferric uptake transcriptional regulator|tara:strand:+ start:225 stop:665 length:441 start_codon:yes stop_codon:yes gene_type:complete